MKRLILLFMFVVVAVAALPAFAFDPTLPNNPAVNPDANACLTGGLWEGKCGDSEYMWAGGWYLIRFHAGLIPREIYPDQYKWALPSLKAQLSGSGFPFPTCTATSTSGVTSTYEVVAFAASGTGYHAVASSDPGYVYIDFYMYYGTKWQQSEGAGIINDIVSTTCNLPSFP